MDGVAGKFKAIARKEKKLRQVLQQAVAQPSQEGSVAKRVLRGELRGLYEDLVFAHRAASASKEAESNLWKVCFYKRIEELRAAVRRASGPPTRLSKSTPEERAKRADRARAALMSFLADATSFYHSLLLRFQELRRADPSDSLARWVLTRGWLRAERRGRRLAEWRRGSGGVVHEGAV